MVHEGVDLRHTEAGQQALRELAKQRTAARHWALIAVGALVATDVLFLFVVDNVPHELLALDAAMLVGMVVLWHLGRSFPIVCALLGLFGYLAIQIFAFGVGTLPGELFKLEVIFKMCWLGQVLRAVMVAATTTGRLRAQGLTIEAPAELPTARTI